MLKILFGIVTYGNTMFTEKAIDSIMSTYSGCKDIFVVIGKPGDMQTQELLYRKQVHYIMHDMNKGFPASVNDITDYAFKKNGYDAVIIMGNDVIAYENTLDSMVEAAEAGYLCVNTTEITSKYLVQLYPECSQYFVGNDLIINDLSNECWKKFVPTKDPVVIQEPSPTVENPMVNIHNLCLYTREYFDKAGYIDTNFYKAYFEDDDYNYRRKLLDLKVCNLANRYYFHFWSRTIKQGSGGSTNKLFEFNREYYIHKWGGEPHHEAYTIPFDGKPYTLEDGLILTNDINIQSRELEPKIINYWSNK
jgi:GT2 family glycosyltransferase